MATEIKRMEQDRLKPGDIIYWLSDQTRTVIDVLPYTGRYPEFFDCTLVLSSPQTRSGKIEMAHKQAA